MKLHEQRGRQGRLRTSTGQAMAGGAAMMVMISILGAGMMMLLANLAILSNDYNQLQGIASEAARQVASSRLCFGMERPEWRRGKAEGIAIQALTAELDVLGYKLNGNPEFSYRMATIHRNGTGNDIPTMIVECNMSISPTPSLSSAKGLFFLCPPRVSGISSDSENAVRRHAMALVMFIDPTNPNIKRGIRVPVYNYTRINNMSSRPNMIKGGRSVGHFPNGTLRVWAPVQGWFKRDKTRRVGNNP